MGRVDTLRWNDGQLELVDQTRLPRAVEYKTITTVQQLHEAIATMVVRGAPAIGVAAAYGMVLAAKGLADANFTGELKQAGAYLAAARPTAVNLRWAVDRMLAKANALADRPVAEQRAALEAEAIAIHKEDLAANRAIGEYALSLLKDGDTVLTHCNAGSLATSGYGTALSAFYLARERGINLRVYADETRPRFQGAMLTCFELMEGGVDVTLICDNTAAFVMSQGKIDAVIVGCDRVAANGDVANKVGTLSVSVLAKHFGVPFYVAGPTSTVDMDCPTGAHIPVEERSPDEVTTIGGTRVAPEGVKVYCPAFDVTPADNITAIITERGIVRAPFAQGLKELMKG